MSRRRKHPEPFFMIFPWLRTAGLISLFTFVLILVWRLSETAGIESYHACTAAMMTTVLMGLCSLYPLCKIWREPVIVGVIAVMIGSAIRLLIGGAGVAIITFFTQLNKSWFVFYVAVYYVFFLIMDTAFALWMLNYCRRNDDKEHQVHGNLWDMVG